ncbi:MAG: hypothetical protein AB1305_06060 [Candidatus Hadarchaeota archaeon]
MRRDARGVESLPAVLLLSVAMGAAALSLGIASLDQFERSSERQLAVQGFQNLVEEAALLGAGGVGGTRAVDLDVGRAKVLVNGTIAELSLENQKLKAEAMPLPISARELATGSYIMELKRGPSGLFIGVRRV